MNTDEKETIAAFGPQANLPTGDAVNPQTNRIYVTNQNDNTVSVLQDH
jgi:DNA-binding beta-propeller fold protein YncE